MSRQKLYSIRRQVIAWNLDAPQKLLNDIQSVANVFATNPMCLPEHFGLLLSEAVSKALVNYRHSTGTAFAEHLTDLDARIASFPPESWEISA